MPVPKDIALRPRFKLELSQPSHVLLEAFEVQKNGQSEFVVNRLDSHVFIKYPKDKQHFWSPQLHLEIDSVTHESSLLYGLFGPSPTAWTLFMFLHFVVAGLFFGASVWAYSNWTLKVGYALQLTLMGLMVVLWFLLYFVGRIGRDSSKKDMRRLQYFMNDTLHNIKA